MLNLGKSMMSLSLCAGARTLRRRLGRGFLRRFTPRRCKARSSRFWTTICTARSATHYTLTHERFCLFRGPGSTGRFQHRGDQARHVLASCAPKRFPSKQHEQCKARWREQFPGAACVLKQFVRMTECVRSEASARFCRTCHRYLDLKTLNLIPTVDTFVHLPQGGSIAEVVNATFNLDVDAVVQKVYLTQTQLLQVRRSWSLPRISELLASCCPSVMCSAIVL